MRTRMVMVMIPLRVRQKDVRGLGAREEFDFSAEPFSVKGTVWGICGGGLR